MKDQSSELFFVEVKEPSEVRKNILETLRQIIELLQRFERFRQARHEKLQSIQHLRVLMKQANTLMGTLKLKLPQTNLKATLIKESVAAAKKPVAKKKKKEREAVEQKAEKPQKRDLSELDKLEAELSAIESKLKDLA